MVSAPTKASTDVADSVSMLSCLPSDEWVSALRIWGDMRTISMIVGAAPTKVYVPKRKPRKGKK